MQDMYHTTETARCAHLILPAGGWGEKEGTFINSERRIGVIKAVSRPPGEALPDFAIFKRIADYWGCGDMFREWESPAVAFQILKRLSQGQPCDFSAITDTQAVEDQGGIQWPYAGATPPKSTERRLFEDGVFFHADGKARFLFEASRPLTEPPNDRYPFLLLTGRGSVAQWHTETRTGKSAVLRELAPKHLIAEINPADAQRLGIGPNEWIVIESARGQLVPRHFSRRPSLPVSSFFPCIRPKPTGSPTRCSIRTRSSPRTKRAPARPANRSLNAFLGNSLTIVANDREKANCPRPRRAMSAARAFSPKIAR